MTIAILIHEELGHVQEIQLDITPSKNEIFQTFGWTTNFYRAVA